MPLPGPLLELLRGYWLSHRHPRWLFPSPQKKGLRVAEVWRPMDASGVQKALRRVVKESGLNKRATVHTLRHSYGRPFGRLINASLDAIRCQRRISSPWRFNVPSHVGLVSFQGT